MRFAILGTGMVAEYHRSAMEAASEKGVELVAVVHHDPAQFEVLSGRFGVRCVTESDLLADPRIDAVAICTPSGQHADQAIRAAEAGKHVLVEKPMALSLDDADRMIAACRRAGVQLGVVFQRRFEPVFQAVHQAVTGGDLGTPTIALLSMPYLRTQAYYDQADWRGTWALDGGGVLMNQGIHLIDLLVWMMGDPVDIAALGGTLQRKIEVEDTVGAVVRFPGGAVGTIVASTAAGDGFAHRLELYGSRGGIQIEGEVVRRWDHADPSLRTVEAVAVDAPIAAGSAADPRGIAAEGHHRVVVDFADAVRDGRAPAVDGSEGRRSLAAILGIYRAAGLR